MGVRNEQPEEVLRQALLLRSSTGRKASTPVKKRHVTRTPSIQGAWQLPPRAAAAAEGAAS